MNWLKKMLERWEARARQQERARYEAYLSQATDLYHLEHLERSLDRRRDLIFSV